MSTLTMNRLSAAVTVLASMAARFPGLPAPNAEVSRIYLDQVTLSFYDDLGQFEVWRSALGVAPAGVVLETECGGGPLVWLRANVVVDGVTVELVGYGQVPAGRSGKPGVV
ncbi:hypothetical protein ACWCQE_30790 [Streptomyces sp. NPDC002409]